MPWRKRRKIFFPWYRVANGHVQEPTPGSAVQFLRESVCKNRPLVLRSNVAGSWAWGCGGRWGCCKCGGVILVATCSLGLAC